MHELSAKMKLLKARWLQLCDRVDIDGKDQWSDLHRRSIQSGLAYHNLDHVEDCLDRLTRRIDEADDGYS